LSLEICDALEQRDALRVRPVQILEDNHRRTVGGQPQKHPQSGPQALDLSATRVGESVELLGIDAVATVHCGQKQFEGTTQRSRLGLAHQHRGLRREPVEQLPDQPRLADARLAGQHRDVGVRRASELHQPVQLFLPSDHCRTGSRRTSSRSRPHPISLTRG
jgi:hypothetical protein